MNKKKLAMSLTSLALVGAVAVGGTLAYLSSTSKTVNNTFSVGTGYIPDGEHTGLWLDEAEWKDGQLTGNRIEKGNEYKDMMPGSVVDKDPTFHMTKGSTPSYVIARVVNLDKAMANGYTVSVEKNGEAGFDSHWVKIANLDGTTLDTGFGGADGYYAYEVEPDNYILDASKAVETVDLAPMFNYVTLNGEIEDLKTVDDSEITISGVAVQAENNTLEGALQVAMEKLN